MEMAKSDINVAVSVEIKSMEVKNSIEKKRSKSLPLSNTLPDHFILLTIYYVKRL